MDTIADTSISRFADFADRALEKYDIPAQGITFLQHSENVTFKITTSGDPYLLRLHLPLTKGMGTHGLDPEVIRSEMLWLNSLRRNKLPVPRPVLEWLEGDLYTREMETENSVAQIGNLVGRIHRYASRWRLPHGFQRPRRDAVYFINVLESLQPAVDDGRIHYQDFKILQTAIRGLSELIQSMRKTRNTVGLIHGDLHRGNFLNHNGEIRLIDFSLCAFGNFTYDLGTCLSNVNPALHSIFLSNYDRLFPLSNNYDRLIEGFFIASCVVTFSFWLDNPDAQETLVQRVPYIAQEYATRFNKDERFWIKN
jgi:Ser/Thr protein kinase RdoA (MazF antagonist)